MRRFILTLLVAMLIAPVAWAAPPAPKSPATVLDVDAAYRVARKAEDMKTIETMLAPNFVTVDHTGHLMTRAQFLAWVGNRKAHFKSWDTTDLKVNVTGKTAVVTGLSTYSGEFEHQGKLQTLKHTVRVVRVWVETPGGWKLATLSWTRIGK